MLTITGMAQVYDDGSVWLKGGGRRGMVEVIPRPTELVVEAGGLLETFIELDDPAAPSVSLKAGGVMIDRTLLFPVSRKT